MTDGIDPTMCVSAAHNYTGRSLIPLIHHRAMLSGSVSPCYQYILSGSQSLAI